MRADIHEAFDEIIVGKSVKRSLHSLVYGGEDLTTSFLSALNRHNYLPVTVGSVAIEPGERVPAFYLRDRRAFFGWIFWEKFTELRLRKLFGTVVRNTKGDWLHQLPSNTTTIIYANTSLVCEMDIDRPFEL